MYGKSKLEGEEHIKKASEQYFIIRTSWLYSKFKNNFLHTIHKKVKNKEDLKIISSQKGTPTSCSDLAEFIIFLILNQNKTYGIYHFTAFGETSWYDFAKQIASNYKGYNSEKIQPIGVYKTKANRPKYSVLSVKKAQEIYPKITSWTIGVNNTIQSLKTSGNN